MLKITSVICGLLFSLLFSYTVNGQFSDNCHFQHLRELNLQANQEAQINQIKNTYQDQINTQKSQLNSKQKALHGLLQNQNASTAAQISSLEQEIQSLQTSIYKLKVQTWREIKEVLDPVQKQKLHRLQLQH